MTLSPKPIKPWRTLAHFSTAFCLRLRSSFLRLSFAARAVPGLGYKEFPQTAFQKDAFMGIGSFIQGRFNDKTQKVRCMLDGKVQILPAQDVGKKRAGKDISCTAGPKGEFWYFILFRES